eukprot:PhM_4_TR12421/c0_g1_i2/m.86817
MSTPSPALVAGAIRHHHNSPTPKFENDISRSVTTFDFHPDNALRVLHQQRAAQGGPNGPPVDVKKMPRALTYFPKYHLVTRRIPMVSFTKASRKARKGEDGLVAGGIDGAEGDNRDPLDARITPLSKLRRKDFGTTTFNGMTGRDNRACVPLEKFLLERKRAQDEKDAYRQLVALARAQKKAEEEAEANFLGLPMSNNNNINNNTSADGDDNNNNNNDSCNDSRKKQQKKKNDDDEENGQTSSEEKERKRLLQALQSSLSRVPQYGIKPQTHTTIDMGRSGSRQQPVVYMPTKEEEIEHEARLQRRVEENRRRRQKQQHAKGEDDAEADADVEAATTDEPARQSVKNQHRLLPLIHRQDEKRGEVGATREEGQEQQHHILPEKKNMLLQLNNYVSPNHKFRRRPVDARDRNATPYFMLYETANTGTGAGLYVKNPMEVEEQRRLYLLQHRRDEMHRRQQAQIALAATDSNHYKDLNRRKEELASPSRRLRSANKPRRHVANIIVARALHDDSRAQLRQLRQRLPDIVPGSSSPVRSTILEKGSSPGAISAVGSGVGRCHGETSDCLAGVTGAQRKQVLQQILREERDAGLRLRYDDLTLMQFSNDDISKYVVPEHPTAIALRKKEKDRQEQEKLSMASVQKPQSPK